jgi:hypothetical protein
LENKEPLNVASAFYSAMQLFDNFPDKQDTEHNEDTLNRATLNESEIADEDHQSDTSMENTNGIFPMSPQVPRFLNDFLHVLQFCHICHIGSISPVLYQVFPSIEVKSWYLSISMNCRLLTKQA